MAPISRLHFDEALRAVRSSVAKAELEHYRVWNREFGSFSMDEIEAAQGVAGVGGGERDTTERKAVAASGDGDAHEVGLGAGAGGKSDRAIDGRAYMQDASVTGGALHGGDTSSDLGSAIVGLRGSGN